MQVINGKEFQVEYFAEPHQDEYVLSELKDGKVYGIVQLFKRGVLQLSWRIEDGRKVGGVTMYGDGKAECTMDWKFFTGMDLRALENTKRGLQLVISDPITGIAVYRGEYNNDKELREGRGYVYDGTTGKVLYYGVFKNDQIYRYLQEFEGDKMVEYSEGEESNANLLDRSPIYVGGYIFDETTDTYKRNGPGNVIDPASGLASGESIWENGIEKEGSIRFTNGWYGPNDMIVPSLRAGERQETVVTMEPTPKSKASAPLMVTPSVPVDTESHSDNLPVESIHVEHISMNLPLIPEPLMPKAVISDNVPAEEPVTNHTLVYEDSIPTQPVGMPKVPAVPKGQPVGMPTVPAVPKGQPVGMPVVPAVPKVQSMYDRNSVEAKSQHSAVQVVTDYSIPNAHTESNSVTQPKRTESFYSGTSYPQETEDNPLNNSLSIVIQQASDLEYISSTVVDFTVADHCCNESNITSLNLQVLEEVKTLVIGDECFMNLIGFELRGMVKLEKFIVGKNSFTMSKNNKGERKNCSLVIADCNRLSEITIGAFSFSDYCSIQLINLHVLKTLQIGDPNSNSFCFYNSDFRVMSRSYKGCLL